MKLGMQVGLGPGDFVLDGDQAIPKKGDTSPNFRPMSIVWPMVARSATAELLYEKSQVRAVRRVAQNTCEPTESESA